VAIHPIIRISGFAWGFVELSTEQRLSIVSELGRQIRRVQVLFCRLLGADHQYSMDKNHTLFYRNFTQKFRLYKVVALVGFTQKVDTRLS
jgi:hypothetical protein